MHFSAPIVLFTFKRLDTLFQTVEALQNNRLSINSDLIIFSDAGRNEEEKIAVAAVREYINTISGFRSVTINVAANNKGLAKSIIDGVSSILEQYETVIVLEDDLVISPNFLEYMNQALTFYRDEKKVFSIAGFSTTIKPHTSESDVYFTSRSSSWGWATWNDRWTPIDWSVADYANFKTNSKLRKAFNKMGSDMANMLDRQMAGKINSWAIRWCYHQFKTNSYSVHPFVSKVQNIGFNSIDASNTKERFNRYKTVIDTGEEISCNFSIAYKLEPRIIKQFTKPFSITSRLKYKIINSLFKN